MNKKGQIVTVMITLAIGLILGIIMLSIIFSTVSDQVTQTAVSNDQFVAAANGTCARVTPDCFDPGTGVVINETNETPLDLTGNFSECGANAKIYGFVVSGKPEFIGVTFNTSYTEQSCALIEGAITTLIVNNFAVLFAVVLLVFTAGFLILRQ